jgi:hypothetical protein
MSRQRCSVGPYILPLLLGLTACGNPPPEQPGAGPVVGSTSVGQSAPASRAAAPTTLSEAKPEGLSAEASGHTSPLPNGRVPAVAFADKAVDEEKARAEQDLRSARERWYGEMRESPDVTTRLQALEFWAQQRGEALDPVSLALVDEDESVRTRAQELWEQQFLKGVQGVRGSD